MALTQSHFRVGKDDGTESSHTFWQLEDVNHSQFISADWAFLLRFCVQADATGLTNVDNEFQYNKNGAGWVNITTTSSIVKAVAVGTFTNGENCTKRLSGTGTFETTAAGCTEDGISGGTANDIVASGNSETEAGLQVVFADVANNDTIQFRLTRDGGVLLNTYAVTPTLTVTVPVNITVTPGTASLVTTLYTPTVTVSNNIIVTPGTLALATTLYTPSTILGEVVVPGVVALTLSLYTPTVTVEAAGVTVIPGTASLVITLYTSTVTATDNKIVTLGTVALILSLYTPSVSIGSIVTPGTLALILTLYTPTVSISQNVLVTPGLAIFNITPYTPLVLLFTTYGGVFLWTAANWGSVNVYMEVYMRATTGTVYGRLIDSDNNIVTNSEVNTTLTTFQRLRSPALTLVNTKTYRNQFGKAGGDAGEFLGARIIMIPA